MDDLQANDPTVLGKYTLVGRLGSGGFGIVYLATDPLGNQVAIKVLRSELADDQRLRTRLAREARAIAAVQGNRTAKVFEVVTDGPVAYLVMEYVQGESLDTLVRQNQKPEGPLLWFIALGLVEAVQEIHAAGITHRDLKPSNVIIGPDGVKVVDFGISAITDEAGFTQTGTLMGSAAWLSPEQVTGASTDQRTDIFNLGLTLAFLATGQHPFGEGRPDAVMYRITTQTPNLVSVPGPLRIAIEKCLQKNPVDRPSLEVLNQFFSTGGSEPNEIDLGFMQEADSTFVVQPSELTSAALRSRNAPHAENASSQFESSPNIERRKIGLRLLTAFVVVAATISLVIIFRQNGDSKETAKPDTTIELSDVSQPSEEPPDLSISEDRGTYKQATRSGYPARWINCSAISVSYDFGSMPFGFREEQAQQLREVVNEVAQIAGLDLQANQFPSKQKSSSSVLKSIHISFRYDYYGSWTRSDATVNLEVTDSFTENSDGTIFLPISGATINMTSTVPSGSASTGKGKLRIALMLALGMVSVNSNVDLMGTLSFSTSTAWGPGDLRGLKASAAKLCGRR